MKRKALITFTLNNQIYTVDMDIQGPITKTSLPVIEFTIAEKMELDAKDAKPRVIAWSFYDDFEETTIPEYNGRVQ